jgi:hypothetical protein
LKRKFIEIGLGRRVPVALVAVAAGCLIAACGSASSGSSSSSSTSSTTASASASGTGGSAAGSARRTQLVACLKSHGVTLPARPAGSPPPGGGAGGSGGGAAGGSGGGTGGGSGTGTGPRRGFFGGGGRTLTPKMRAAFQACGAKFGFGGGAGGGGFRGRISHTAVTKYVACVRQHGYNLPNPNFSGKGPIFPQSIQTNAKFQAASKACQSLLIPPRPSGGTSTTSGA